jgi:hypothetical protein
MTRCCTKVLGDQLLCHPVFAIECLRSAINTTDYTEQRLELVEGFEWMYPDGTTAELALKMQRR